MDKQKRGRPPVLPIAAMLFWNYSRKTRRKHSQVDVAHVDQLTDTQSYYWYLSRHDAEKSFGSHPPTHGVLSVPLSGVSSIRVTAEYAPNGASQVEGTAEEGIAGVREKMGASQGRETQVPRLIQDENTIGRTFPRSDSS